MDGFRNLPRDAQIVLGLATAYIVVSFLNWRLVVVASLTFGQSEWEGVGIIGIVAGMIGVVLLLWEVGRALGAQFTMRGRGTAMTSLVLAVLLALVTLIAFLTHAAARHWAAWLGVAVSLALAAVAWMRARREGVQLPVPSA